ncbi:hypothetical protein Dsin_022511 [Dipteronia sinensis]|uniref:Jacalin-type lectin domain-containing protein n=1 Tax=Dipteronia sinensis TaxID=43782 RepID=A0AAE0A2Z6_9ROSI|nr:hypothetical protein Dsin_022511 [Dipteronia sinensis]
MGQQERLDTSLGGFVDFSLEGEILGLDVQEIIKIGPWGGEGGDKWDVKPPSINSSITEINISHGDVVNSLSFKSVDRVTGKTKPSPTYGGRGSKTEQVSMGSMEYLTSISGTVKNHNGNIVVESITFVSIDGTNTNTNGPYGSPSTTGSSFNVPIENGEIVGFFERATANQHINAIGIHEMKLVGGGLRLKNGDGARDGVRLEMKRDSSYLPSQTPNGLKRLRGEELNKLRRNGQGERQTSDRIYDYDVYNDIGDPDGDLDLARPVLGDERSYPRRGRTGRPHCEKYPSSETRSSLFYVPRDEDFSEVRERTFSTKAALLPSFEAAAEGSDLGFRYFTAVDSLFNEGDNLPNILDLLHTLTGQGFGAFIPEMI